MSTLQTTNIKNPAGISTNIALDTSGGVVISGVTTVSAGSASAPAISASGDPNTGIFFPSADTIAFAEGGVEAARFDSSGRLGISTTSPNTLLDVRSTSGAAAFFELNSGSTNNATNASLTLAARTSSARSTGFAAGLSFQHQDNSGAYAGCQIASIPNADLNTANLVLRSRNYGYTDVLTATSDGNIQINNGNLVFSTAGKGIDFSATANSSGTMTSELLSDYEQGTWDCRPSTSTSSIVLPSGITSVNFSGTYVKIGSMVYLTGYFESSQSSVDGSVVYLRLPFVVDGATNMWSSTGTETNSWSYPSGVTYVTVRPENSQSYATFKGCGSGIQRVDITANRIFATNGAYWIGMMMYRTSS